MIQKQTNTGYKIQVYIKTLIVACLIYLISIYIYPESAFEQSIAFLVMCTLFKKATSVYKACIQENRRISKKRLAIVFLLFIAIELGFLYYDQSWQHIDSNSKNDSHIDTGLEYPWILQAVENLSVTLPEVPLPGPVQLPELQLKLIQYPPTDTVEEEEEEVVKIKSPESALLDSTTAESPGEEAPSGESATEIAPEEAKVEEKENKFLGLTKSTWKAVAVLTLIVGASYSHGVIKETTRAVVDSIQGRLFPQQNE
jgi:hypothetical protein